MGKSKMKTSAPQASQPELYGDPIAAASKEVRAEISMIMKERQQRDYRSISSLDHIEKNHTCCKCCYIDPERKEEEKAIILWHKKHCRTYEELTHNMGLTTTTYMTAVASVRAIISNLTYWDDPSAGLEGLSVVGGNIWLITSALHHLLDDHGTLSSVSLFYKNSFEITTLLYQELAGAVEKFLDVTDEYFLHVHRMRNDGQIIVKKFVEKWQLQDSDPLLARPMMKPRRRRPRKHIGKGLDFEEDLEQDDNFFHLQLKHQRIVCRHKDTGWIPFVDLHPSEKIDVCHLFLQRTRDIIDNGCEDIGKVLGNMSTETINPCVRSQAREITGAMRNFAKSYKRKGPILPKDQENILRLLQEFWLALDRLHDDSYQLLRLAQETRDIIRTCYIYLDAFYKWDMPDYDNFLLCLRKRKEKQDTKKAVKFFWEKLVTYNHEHRKLSEVMKFLSLSDFTTSIYQLVVEKHPIRADGICMKIGPCCEESVAEPWGLVEGTDLRKTTSRKKIARNYSSYTASLQSTAS